ncbi:MAG: hypothetical protein IT214_02645 [Chitinophagaceae bacterium]|nr:hypothetical protein [Chitinophagaceae bacterium]
MKRLIFLLMLIILFPCFFSFAYTQPRIHKPLSDRYQDYDTQMQYFLAKSKMQKKTGWMLFGSGMAVNLIGTSIYSNNQGGEAGLNIISGISEAGIISGIAFFFASAKNKERAQLIYFTKNVETANSEEIRLRYLREASEYFKSKSRGNLAAAIVLSAAGAACITGGVVIIHNANDRNNVVELFGDAFAGTMLFVSGIGIGAFSIPFYIKSARQRRTAEMILRTGRIPHPVITSSPPFNTGRYYYSAGIRISL